MKAIALLSLAFLCVACNAEDTLRGVGTLRQSGTVRKVQNPVTCVKQKTALDCDLLDGCVWCEGSKVGTGCYPKTAAKILPSKYFDCDKPVGPSSTAAEQQSSVTRTVCDGLPQATCVAPLCVWCESWAVQSACYTPEEAKKLPKAVFTCKTGPSQAAA